MNGMSYLMFILYCSNTQAVLLAKLMKSGRLIELYNIQPLPTALEFIFVISVIMMKVSTKNH